MDTGKTLSRQLKYCAAAAETKEEQAQVAWWQTQVEELRKQQPSAAPKQLEFVAHPVETGTGGGR